MGHENNIIPEKLNLASFFLDHNIAVGRGKKVAIYYGDEEYTYNDIFVLSNKVGNVLKELGVERENRAYSVLIDSPECVAIYYGAFKIGAMPTIGYSFLSPKEYLEELNSIRPKVVITDVAYLDRLREAIKDSRFPKYVLVVGKSIPELKKGEFDFYSMVNKADDHLDVEPTLSNDVASWGFSGGTTGLRKIVSHRQCDIVFAYNAYNHIMHYTEKDVICPVPKFYFGYGRIGSILFPFRVGAAAILFPERATAEKIFELIRKHKPSILINVPTMMRKMIQTQKKERADLSCLRLCTSAGEALSKELYHEWIETFGVEVIDGIGSAETYYFYACNIPGRVIPGSVGKPLPGYEVKIVDEDGQELPNGEIGILSVKGPNTATHYLHHYEKTKKTFRGEWVYTDDLFSKDKEGNLYFFSRRDELIKVSGYFVSPLEIEECIMTHPDVSACAVVGVRDKDGLDKTKAFVILKEGAIPSETLAEGLKEYAKMNLSPHKYPRFIEFVDELPFTSSDKIDRKKLKGERA